MESSSSSTEIPSCPFCPFSDSDFYFLAQHVELYHPENGASPFIVTEGDAPYHMEDATGRDSEDVTKPHWDPDQQDLSVTNGQHPNTSMDEEQDSYIDCPHKCGETITPEELPIHLDLHVAEKMALDEVEMQNDEGDTNIQSYKNNGYSVNYQNNNDGYDDDHYYDDPEARFSTAIPKALRNHDGNSQKSSSRSLKKSRKSAHRSDHSLREAQQSKPKKSRRKFSDYAAGVTGRRFSVCFSSPCL